MITVTITLDDLIKHGACKEGIDLFKILYPNGIASAEWSVENQVKLITEVDPGREFLQWLMTRGLLPMWHLRHANLSYTNLSNADLHYTDLRSANLRGADCRGTDFTGANLAHANLTNIITDENTKGLPS